MTARKALLIVFHLFAAIIVWWVSAFIVFILLFAHRFASQLDSLATLAGLPTIAAIVYLYCVFRLLPRIRARHRRSADQPSDLEPL